MFTHAYPHFQKGRILKTAMLEQLRDYPRDYLELRYRNYANGIIAGAEVKVKADKLSISPGIVLYHGKLYMLTEQIDMSYVATGRMTLLKVRLLEETTIQDITTGSMELVLDEEECSAGELELGRFKLKEGARLRQDYQTFADLATEFNTLHVIHVPYAAEGASTLSPLMMRDYADRLMRTGTTDPLDLTFAMMCLNEGIVNRRVIQHYIASRLGQEVRDYGNAQIHRYLDRILAGAGGRGGRPGYLGSGPQRMIVD
ncbi:MULTISPECIES: DNA and RNA helicase [Paenibacillus]|uniref:DNA and RNA helicase n=1 Tax=Paenibacillus TaxID=44249 RepID=UPI001F3598DA|nr:DNA and RNA helicase [Paenibacillus sp. JJ-223]CAH1225320.1 hypothetical protein PAECIP111890_05784 [Paenibacillus sp. JJ-223]